MEIRRGVWINTIMSKRDTKHLSMLYESLVHEVYSGGQYTDQDFERIGTRDSGVDHSSPRSMRQRVIQTWLNSPDRFADRLIALDGDELYRELVDAPQQTRDRLEQFLKAGGSPELDQKIQSLETVDQMLSKDIDDRTLSGPMGDREFNINKNE